MPELKNTEKPIIYTIGFLSCSLHFPNKEISLFIYKINKKNQFLNSKLQEFKGDMVECYVYQLHKGKLSEVSVCFAVK